MISIIPSIAILGGRLARLEQGSYQKAKYYDKSPVDIVRTLEDHGIKQVHIVDLDGARERRMMNFDILDTIRQYTSIKIDYSGGLVEDGDVAKAYEAGADILTFGSVAIKDPDQLVSWIISYGHEKIALSADCFNGTIRINGWTKDTGVKVYDHIEKFYNNGIKYVKCVDVSREGLLSGPNFEMCKTVRERFPNIQILASGGISTMDHIRQLDDLGVYGAIIGKAFYEDKITLADISKYMKQSH